MGNQNDCPHDMADIDTATADGYCPICLLERIEALQAENAALTAKVERLTARGIQDLQHENAALREQIAQVKADAYEDIESWAGYASSYFLEKHDLAGCLEKYLTQEQQG